jgi:hypothetical protein
VHAGEEHQIAGTPSIEVAMDVWRCHCL